MQSLWRQSNKNRNSSLSISLSLSPAIKTSVFKNSQSIKCWSDIKQFLFEDLKISEWAEIILADRTAAGWRTQPEVKHFSAGRRGLFIIQYRPGALYRSQLKIPSDTPRVAHCKRLRRTWWLSRNVVTRPAPWWVVRDGATPSGLMVSIIL